MAMLAEEMLVVAMPVLGMLVELMPVELMPVLETPVGEMPVAQICVDCSCVLPMFVERMLVLLTFSSPKKKSLKNLSEFKLLLLSHLPRKEL